MAKEESRFFDSTQDDPRQYTADQFAEYFRSFLSDGIKNGGSNLQVSLSADKSMVEIDYGVAMMRGYFYALKNNETGKKTIPLELPSAGKNRIDRVVVKLENRMMSIDLLKGDEATAAPIAPKVKKQSETNNYYTLSLARIEMINGDIKVFDERLDTEVCGLINSLITVDTTQMQETFETFMAQIETENPVKQGDIQNNLTTEAAGKVLDARQGKVLDDKLSAHMHSSTLHNWCLPTEGSSANLKVVLDGYDLVDMAQLTLKLHVAIADNATLQVNDGQACEIRTSDGSRITAGAVAGSILPLCYNKNQNVFYVIGGGGQAVYA